MEMEKGFQGKSTKKREITERKSVLCLKMAFEQKERFYLLVLN